METPARGLYALVSYLPLPLGSFLDELRQSLPGSHFAPAHITILPPRPLEVTVNAASECARTVLQGFTAFDVELTEVRRFPETGMLFLDLADGNRSVHNLHDALNTGVLAFAEEFEFRPHLTLGGPIPPASMPTFQAQAEGAWNSWQSPKRFRLNNIVGLSGTPGVEGLSWRRVWTHQLSDVGSKGAGAGN